MSNVKHKNFSKVDKINFKFKKNITPAVIDLGKPLGKQLRDLRLKSGITAIKLGKIAKIEPYQISFMEADKRERLGVEMIYKYLQACGIGSYLIIDTQRAPEDGKLAKRAYNKIRKNVVIDDYAVFVYRQSPFEIYLADEYVYLPAHFAKICKIPINEYRLTFSSTHGVKLSERTVGGWKLSQEFPDLFMSIISRAWVSWLIKHTDRVSWAKKPKRYREAELRQKVKNHIKQYNLEL